MRTYEISWGDRRLTLGRRTCIMGVLNITPDSFSDGGRFHDPAAALARARQMVADGADIIDIGGESSRPFSEPVSEAVEIERTIPVIEQLAREIPVPISIDTTKSGVAAAALRAGASIINDISAFRIDPAMSALAAESGVPAILMHMQGTPKTMQENPVYADVTREVADFLQDAADRAEKAGIDRSKIIIDPGFGFGKTRTHNYLLLRDIDRLTQLGLPLLVGLSRKAFIRKTLAVATGSEPRPDSPEVEIGTQAVLTAAILAGAHILRVHNVAEAVVTATLIDTLKAQGDPHAAGY